MNGTEMVVRGREREGEREGVRGGVTRPFIPTSSSCKLTVTPSTHYTDNGVNILLLLSLPLRRPKS